MFCLHFGDIIVEYRKGLRKALNACLDSKNRNDDTLKKANYEVLEAAATRQKIFNIAIRVCTQACETSVSTHNSERAVKALEFAERAAIVASVTSGKNFRSSVEAICSIGAEEGVTPGTAFDKFDDRTVALFITMFNTTISAATNFEEKAAIITCKLACERAAAKCMHL